MHSTSEPLALERCAVLASGRTCVGPRGRDLPLLSTSHSRAALNLAAGAQRKRHQCRLWRAAGSDGAAASPRAAPPHLCGQVQLQEAALDEQAHVLRLNVRADEGGVHKLADLHLQD